jgi:DNA-binding MarR family transcriptional regulator
MEREQPWYHEIVTPGLLRHARTTYGKAMRRALDEAGYDDIPSNGLYVIGGLYMGAEGVPITSLMRQLRVSRQAAGQLVDTLVSRGYLARTPDENDRRQMIVTLTERGKAAGEIQGKARDEIETRLYERVGEKVVKAGRRMLAGLIELDREDEEAEAAKS